MPMCVDLPYLRQISLITKICGLLQLIKRPARREFSQKGPPYPPAPQVCLPIASLLVDGISSNLAHIFSSPGKIF